MADPLSVAGLATGVVSLGLQISQGITTYIDALNCRDQDLVSVRQRNETLRQILHLVETSRSQLQSGPGHQVATAAIRECLDSCKKELKVLEDLVTDLTTHDQFTAGLIDKVKNKSKKLLYPFSRPKLEQLETRLRNANVALQLALQILGLSVSHLGTEKLVTLEASSYTLSTSFHKVQSEVTAMSLPLQGIQSSISGFEARFGNMENLLQQLLAQQSATNRSTQEITPEVATGRLLAKPGFLRDMCDAAGARARPTSSGMVQAMDHRSTHSSDAISPYTGGSLSCLCRHRRRLRTKNIVLGSLVLSSEAAAEQHQPGCPATQVMIGTDRSQKVGVTYTGLRRLLNSAVQLSFEMSWGAGAWSLRPNFTYYPSVDSETAPAFRILSMLSDMWLAFVLNDAVLWHELAESAVSAILRLFRANKASPRAVDENNRSLVYHLVVCITASRGQLRRRGSGQAKPSPLHALLKFLLDNKAPASHYDLYGHTPLGSVFSGDAGGNIIESSFADATNLILRSNDEVNLAVLDPASSRSTTAGRSRSKLIINISKMGMIHLLPRSIRMAEAYGCGPLSLAILSNNLEQVEHLLRKHPATLAERNLFGFTPLHLAADKPACLRLLVKVADARLLNDADGPDFGLTPLETALCLGGRRCREGTSGRMCQQCSCDECVVILLEADCELSIPADLSDILSKTSQRCKLQYIRGMKDRRDRLKQLALDNLPATELEQLGLMSKTVLNSAAPRVIQLLQDRGVHIPEALAPVRAPVRDGRSSVYRALYWPWDAQLFFEAGFHDTDSWCNVDAAELEVMPTYLRLHDLRYLYWLATHGARSRHVGSFETQREIFEANYTCWKIGEQLSDGPKSFVFNNSMRLHPPLPNEGAESFPFDHCKAWVYEVNAAVLAAEIADNCRCKCSPEGCTPLTSLLKGVPNLTTRAFGPGRRRSLENADPFVDAWFPRGSLPAVASYFTKYVEHCESDLGARHHTAALRYMTFTTLGIPHSCCNPHAVLGHDGAPTPKPVAEEEHAHELVLLDELLGEFEGQVMAILQDPVRGVADVVHFWKQTWVDRMSEVLDDLDGDDLTSDEKRGAEEIGVVWDRPKPLEVDNPYPQNTLKHWMYELEKIEAEC